MPKRIIPEADGTVTLPLEKSEAETEEELDPCENCGEIGECSPYCIEVVHAREEKWRNGGL